MVINVTGRHIEITDTMRERIHAKIERIHAEYPRIESAHVVLTLEKYRQHAEIILQGAGVGRVEAAEESDDMYLSIDRAAARVEKQVRKWLDRVKDHKGEGLGEVEAKAGQEERA